MIRALPTLLFLIAVGFSSNAVAQAPTVADLVSEFDAARYYNIVSNELYCRQGMDRTAGIGPENPLCRAFIHTELLSHGLNATQDVFGQIGVDPGSSWGTPSTANGTLLRNCDVTQGDADGSDAFDPASQWTAGVADAPDGFGAHCL